MRTSIFKTFFEKKKYSVKKNYKKKELLQKSIFLPDRETTKIFSKIFSDRLDFILTESKKLAYYSSLKLILPMYYKEFMNL